MRGKGNKMNIDKMFLYDIAGVQRNKLSRQDFINKNKEILTSIYNKRIMLERAVITSRCFFEQMTIWAELIATKEISVKDIISRGKYSQSELKSKLGAFLLNLKAFKQYLVCPTKTGNKELYVSLKKIGIAKERIEGMKNAILAKRVKCSEKLFNYIKSLDEEVKTQCNEIVKLNIPLAINIATAKGRSYIRQDISLYKKNDDLVQCALLGLYQAAIRFDINANVNFSTYAFYWISSEISKFLSKEDVVRIPKNIQLIQNKLKKFENIGMDKEQIKSELDESDYQIETAMHTKASVSLDEIAFNNDFIYDKNIHELADTYNAEKEVEKKILKENLDAIISKNLDKKDCTILKKYFGIIGEERCTLQEIGDELNMSKEGVRQHINASLKKILPKIKETFGEEYEKENKQEMPEMHSKEKRCMYNLKSSY
jgi:RNA polymerase primary sigma factor